MNHRAAGVGKGVCLHAPANPWGGCWGGQDLVHQALQLSDLCRQLTAQGPLPATPQVLEVTSSPLTRKVGTARDSVEN